MIDSKSDNHFNDTSVHFESVCYSNFKTKVFAIQIITRILVQFSSLLSFLSLETDFELELELEPGLDKSIVTIKLCVISV